MKNFWRNNEFCKLISLKYKSLLVPVLFVASVVVLVSYFAVTYVQAAEKGSQVKKPKISLVEKIRDAEPIKTVSAQELKDLIADDSDLVVINVLDTNWYNESHIPGSINNPVGNKEKFVELMAKYEKDTPIVVYCASKICPLSKDAYKILVHELGFTKVKAYEGGIDDWNKNGFETESND